MLVEHLGDIGVTGTAALLSLVTYMDACKDRPIDQWPHRRAYLKTITVLTAGIVLIEVCHLLAWRRIVHCVRWMRWQTTRLPRVRGKRMG